MIPVLAEVRAFSWNISLFVMVQFSFPFVVPVPDTFIPELVKFFNVFPVTVILLLRIVPEPVLE